MNFFSDNILIMILTLDFRCYSFLKGNFQLPGIARGSSRNRLFSPPVIQSNKAFKSTIVFQSIIITIAKHSLTLLSIALALLSIFRQRRTEQHVHSCLSLLLDIGAYSIQNEYTYLSLVVTCMENCFSRPAVNQVGPIISIMLLFKHFCTRVMTIDCRVLFLFNL